MTLHKPLTFDQEVDLCYIIGDWYLDWKENIIAGPTTHRLGIAKEDLKNRICKPVKVEL